VYGHDPDVRSDVQHHGIFRKEPEEIKEVIFLSVKLQGKDLENGKYEKVIIESKDLLQIFLDGVFHADKYIIYSLITFKLRKADILSLKILYISPRVPFPPTDGGAIVTFNTITEIARMGHEVHLLAINTPKHHQPDHVVPHVAFQEYVSVDTRISPFKAFVNFFKRSSYNIERFISGDFEKALVEILKKNRYDIIQFEGAYVAWYVDLVRKHTDCPILLRAHNIEYTIWKRLSENNKNPLKRAYFKFLTKRLRKFEAEYYPKFDGIATITPEDTIRLITLGISTPHKVIPAAVHSEKISGSISPKPFTVFILSSLDWVPNQEAVHWFLKNVWPGLIKELSQLELHIAGKNMPDHFYKLDAKNVVVHGFVNSSAEFMQQHDLMAVPLLSGGGMRVKIIEGMAMSKVIISSPVGAEGIHCEDGKNILIADKPGEWIKRILDYFRRKADYKHIGENARQLAAGEYSNGKITKDFVDFYKELIAARKR
jgi:polysaccharide biosynthesis protein PslH